MSVRDAWLQLNRTSSIIKFRKWHKALTTSSPFVLAYLPNHCEGPGLEQLSVSSSSRLAADSSLIREARSSQFCFTLAAFIGIREDFGEILVAEVIGVVLPTELC
ncbi:hypothetical protein GQX74_006790 [Glossina fuscipes]|nr:hypothetical protein GQX74_006790 [Glossina fuscipes]